MTMTHKLTALLLAFSLLSLPGCGGADTPDADGEANIEGGSGTKAGSGTKGGANTTGLTAVQTVETFVSAISKDELGTIWELLPAKHQGDINGVVQAFGGKMDAELWNKSFTVVGKLGKVLETKKEYLLNSKYTKDAITNSGVTDQQIDEVWTPTIEMVNTILTSEISNTSKLKTFDGGTFLSGTASSVLKKVRNMSGLLPEGTENPLAEFESMTVKGISSTGDTAVVELSIPSEPKPAKVTFTKVDGKWLPADMIAGWDKGLKEAHEQINGLTPEMFEGVKGMVVPILGSVEGVLDNLLAANSQAEFDGAIEKAMQDLGPILGNFIPGMIPSPDSGGADSVSIKFDEQLDDDTLDDLVNALYEMADDPAQATVIEDSDSKNTSLTVSPVSADTFEDFTLKVGKYLVDAKVGAGYSIAAPTGVILTVPGQSDDE